VATSGTDFNWIAPVYDRLASVVFGNRLKRAQAVYLNRVPAGASVLIVGGGTGWLLEPLLMKAQYGRILYLEPSARMLGLATRRLLTRQLSGRVEFRLGDETALRPDEQFDVVITPFVLDLFTAETMRKQFIPHLRAALKPTGLWLVTDFVQTTVWWQRTLLWSMIHFFRLTAGVETRKLANWQQLLSEAGLTRREQREQVGGMVSAEVWIRLIG
jgi:tRNA (cmo5U34)-methyltransferase